MISFKNISLENKNVFLRMDYNVGILDGKVIDDYKIKASFSTILDVINKNPARIIIGTHIGRPNGQYDEKYSCLPVFNILKQLIKDKNGEDLKFCNIENYNKDKLIMLENLRFYPEEQNISTKCTTLSTFFKNYVDVLIIDSFGVLHRDDFSVCKTGLKPYAGNLVLKEIESAKKIINEGIDLLILGGSKIKDKIVILETLIPKCQTVFIIGALANSILKYHFNIEIGLSKIEEGSAETIEKIFKLAEDHKVKIYVANDFKIKVKNNFIFTKEVPKDGIIVDIGQDTIKEMEKIIQKSNKIFWNGPPGIFENEDSNQGSKNIVNLLSKKQYVVVGGGETAACVQKFGKVEDFFHVSTGGGAFLKLLGNGKMPGIDVLNTNN